MDAESHGDSRQISSAAASRYAHHPPPVPSVHDAPLVPVHAPIPPRLPCHRPPPPPVYGTQAPPVPARAHSPASAVHGPVPVLPPRGSPSRHNTPPPPPPTPAPTPPSPSTVVPPPPPTTQQPHSIQRDIIVTLEHIRQGPRSQNEYVDNPHLVAGMNNHVTGHLGSRERHTLLRGNPSLPNRTQAQEPTLQQPTSTSINLKDHNKDPNLTLEEDHADSIICKKCRKCKCQRCTQPRQLPSTWLCDDKCRCSVEKAVDYCTCLWCLKAVFYHCFKDSDLDDDVAVGEEPCSCCEQPHCCKRWTCIALVSLCMPCLWCYWPLRCGVGACSACYNRCTRDGCHCRNERTRGHNMTKGLLVESESSSA